MTSYELLAPAKDLECGIAAIDCGADAVYIGAPRFGAREAAGNSLEDITALAEYAHKYWAKVYVTVNTLLRDDEIPSVLQMISQLYDAGIDGLIIQDTGLLECDLPPIPLIASTQMHNNTPEKVAFLEQVGFQRVILARELDLDQIREIRSKTSIELEFFVHGALCVCYSGQCYLSYAAGGRSGNRGQCAQPCRKPYSLVDGQGKVVAENQHLLSLKDFNLSSHLNELIDAGVSSFKIEGRLKDKTYVSNVVAYYRTRLDEILQAKGLKKSSSGTVTIDFTPDPAKTFNRGYTTYFLHGKGEPVGSIYTPKMTGEKIGRIISTTKRDFNIDSSTDLHNGDGICFFDRKSELRGTVINKANGRTIVPDKMDGIEKGMIIYRNHDHEFLTRLEKARVERQIMATMTLRETNEGFSLSAVDEDDVQAEVVYTCEKTPAQKPEQALDNIRKQLMKTGGTDFTCLDVTLELSEAYFLPISAINELRHSVLEKLTQARMEKRPKLTGGVIKNDIPYPEARLSYLGNVLNKKAEAFYRRHGVTEIEPAAESGLDMRGRKVMTTRYCLLHQLDMCLKKQKTAHPIKPLYLTDTEGNKLELRFDCARCEMHVYYLR